MKPNKNAKKIIVFICSLLLIAGVTLLYFLDDSLEWNGEKIISLIAVDWWTFFLIPAFVYSWMKLKNMNFAQGFAAGMHIGASGIILPILLAPYYGAKFYFEVKY